jgi:hypothetical protein
LGDLEVDRRIMLKLLLSKYRENMWTGYIGSSGRHVDMLMNSCIPLKAGRFFG